MLMVVAPSLITASSTRQRKSTSERLPSSGDAQLLLARHRGAGALLAVAHGGVEYDQTLLAHGMSPWPFWAGHSTDCRQEYLARGAQQQAAQREKREREKNGNRLLHARHYSGINGVRSRFRHGTQSPGAPGARTAGALVSRPGALCARARGVLVPALDSGRARGRAGRAGRLAPRAHRHAIARHSQG